MGVDLGTWFVRVELEDGRGFIMKWETGSRWYSGKPWNGTTCDLGATRHPPTWDNEDDLLSSMEWQFTSGNYGCDCNLLSFLDDAAGKFDDETERDYKCAHDLKYKYVTAIRPDGTMVNLIGAFPGAEG